jgi:hypothetical protein
MSAKVALFALGVKEEREGKKKRRTLWRYDQYNGAEIVSEVCRKCMRS